MEIFLELKGNKPLDDTWRGSFKDTEYHKAVHTAAWCGTLNILKILLPSPGQAQEIGRQALGWAIESDRANIVEFLLGHGVVSAEPDYQNALRHGSINVLDLLKKQPQIKIGTYFDNGDLQIAHVLKWRPREWREAISFLLEQGSADINATGQNGLTAMHIAAQDGYRTVVQFLKDHGANM